MCWTKWLKEEPMPDTPTPQAIADLVAQYPNARCGSEGDQVRWMDRACAALLSLSARKARLRKALTIQTDLVVRLCDAVDREAEDIGGESALSVLQLLGPNLTAVGIVLQETAP
jgi:hypothetical protein